jgi:GcrA cell cycle regulator
VPSSQQIYAELRSLVAENQANGHKLVRPKTPPTKYEKRPPKYDTDWSDERVELLKRLCGEGLLSFSQIADKIGQVTRNAVIGKVHRLGLAGRAPRKPARAPFRPKPRAIILRPVLPRPRILSPVLREIPDLEPAPDGRIKLLDIKEGMCRWPIGDPMEEGFHFCGRRKSTVGPYCDHHAAIAYNPIKLKPKGKNGFYWLDLGGRNSRAAEKARA